MKAEFAILRCQKYLDIHINIPNKPYPLWGFQICLEMSKLKQRRGGFVANHFSLTYYMIQTAVQ